MSSQETDKTLPPYTELQNTTISVNPSNNKDNIADDRPNSTHQPSRNATAAAPAANKPTRRITVFQQTIRPYLSPSLQIASDISVKSATTSAHQNPKSKRGRHSPPLSPHLKENPSTKPTKRISQFQYTERPSFQNFNDISAKSRISIPSKSQQVDCGFDRLPSQPHQKKDYFPIKPTPKNDSFQHLEQSSPCPSSFQNAKDIPESNCLNQHPHAHRGRCHLSALPPYLKEDVSPAKLTETHQSTNNSPLGLINEAGSFQYSNPPFLPLFQNTNISAISPNDFAPNLTPRQQDLSSGSPSSEIEPFCCNSFSMITENLHFSYHGGVLDVLIYGKVTRWYCPRCSLAFEDNKRMMSHFNNYHAIFPVMMCGMCREFKGYNYSSIRSHQRVCTGTGNVADRTQTLAPEVAHSSGLRWEEEEIDSLVQLHIDLEDAGTFSAAQLADRHLQKYPHRSANAVYRFIYNKKFVSTYNLIRELRLPPKDPTLDKNHSPQHSSLVNATFPEVVNSQLRFIANEPGDFARTATLAIDNKEHITALLAMYYEICSVTASKVPKKRYRKHEGDSDFRPTNKQSVAHRGEFAMMQKAWSRNPSEVWSLLIFGTNSAQPELQEAQEYFSKLFFSASPRPSAASPDQILHNILYPVDESEVREYLKRKRNKSAGPDNLAPKITLNHHIQLTVIINLMLHHNFIPDELRTNKTILIQKKGDSTEITNFRPITIGSIVIRTLTGILAKRVTYLPILHRCQRGFSSNDGCVEATSMLDMVLKTNKDAYVVSIDIKKAFDSVPHQVILDKLAQYGFNKDFIDLVLNLYTNVTTKIHINREQSDLIPMLIGVKQGCALSPFLFNLAINGLFEELERAELGLKLHRSLLPGIGYADDTSLIAACLEEIRKAISVATNYLRGIGLSVNEDKCVSLGNPVPGMKVVDKLTFLGIEFDRSGITPPSLDKFHRYMTTLNDNKCLKPEQKLYLLKVHLIPSFVQLLALSKLNTTTIKEIDREVRSLVRSICHVPQYTPKQAIHLPAKKGGLNVPQLEHFIPKITLKRLNRLVLNHNDFTRDLVTSPVFNSRISDALKLSNNAPSIPVRVRELSTMSHREMSMFQDGVINFSKILQGWSSLNSRQFVSYLQLLYNVAFCRVKSHREGFTEDALCRYGCGWNESVGHILNGCKLSRHLQTDRHNTVLNLVGNYLQDNGWELLRCRRIYLNRLNVPEDEEDNFLMPDFYIKKGSQHFCLDVTIAFESDTDSLAKAWDNKKQKYTDIAPQLPDIFGEPFDGTTEVIPIVFGSLGSVHPLTAKFLKECGLYKYQLQYLSERTIAQSVRIYKWFPFIGRSKKKPLDDSSITLPTSIN